MRSRFRRIVFRSLSKWLDNHEKKERNPTRIRKIGKCPREYRFVLRQKLRQREKVGENEENTHEIEKDLQSNSDLSKVGEKGDDEKWRGIEGEKKIEDNARKKRRFDDFSRKDESYDEELRTAL